MDDQKSPWERVPPSLPPSATPGPLQRGQACQTWHMASGLGTTEVPAGALQLLEPVAAPHTNSLTVRHAFLPQRETGTLGTELPRSSSPAFSSTSSSPRPLRCRLCLAHVTASCRITHTPLRPCLLRSEPCSLMWHQNWDTSMTPTDT